MLWLHARAYTTLRFINKTWMGTECCQLAHGLTFSFLHMSSCRLIRLFTIVNGFFICECGETPTWNEELCDDYAQILSFFSKVSGQYSHAVWKLWFMLCITCTLSTNPCDESRKDAVCQSISLPPRFIRKMCVAHISSVFVSNENLWELHSPTCICSAHAFEECFVVGEPTPTGTQQ